MRDAASLSREGRAGLERAHQRSLSGPHRSGWPGRRRCGQNTRGAAGRDAGPGLAEGGCPSGTDRRHPSSFADRAVDLSAGGSAGRPDRPASFPCHDRGRWDRPSGGARAAKTRAGARAQSPVFAVRAALVLGGNRDISGDHRLRSRASNGACRRRVRDSAPRPRRLGANTGGGASLEAKAAPGSRPRTIRGVVLAAGPLPHEQSVRGFRPISAAARAFHAPRGGLERGAGRSSSRGARSRGRPLHREWPLRDGHSQAFTARAHRAGPGALGRRGPRASRVPLPGGRVSGPSTAGGRGPGRSGGGPGTRPEHARRAGAQLLPARAAWRPRRPESFSRPGQDRRTRRIGWPGSWWRTQAI